MAPANQLTKKRFFSCDVANVHCNSQNIDAQIKDESWCVCKLTISTAKTAMANSFKMKIFIKCHIGLSLTINQANSF